MPRIHVMGASGSGTTTLGRALAAAIGCRHLDTDDFYWMPTDPPYTTSRPREVRIAALMAAFAETSNWVLSGSALKWDDEFRHTYDLVVFLRIAPDIRMRRILAREEARYGARIRPGGDMFEKSQAFLAWAASYDIAGPEHRSLISHEAWIANLDCPVLRLDSALPADDLVLSVLQHPLLRR